MAIHLSHLPSRRTHRIGGRDDDDGRSGRDRLDLQVSSSQIICFANSLTCAIGTMLAVRAYLARSAGSHDWSDTDCLGSGGPAVQHSTPGEMLAGTITVSPSHPDRAKWRLAWFSDPGHRPSHRHLRWSGRRPVNFRWWKRRALAQPCPRATTANRCNHLTCLSRQRRQVAGDQSVVDFDLRCARCFQNGPGNGDPLRRFVRHHQE